MESTVVTRYSKHQKILLNVINSLQSALEDPHLQERLRRILRDLQDEKFRLVVLGQFKRGKSTFLNALLGKAILPTDVIPVTAVITEIVFGQQPGAKIFFLEGEPKEISLEQLADYVTEEKNPKNYKQVDKVLLFADAELLQNGVILVDTPGVGSIHEHNTRLTQEYIPQADAAVFLFSADPPLTELEQDFLKMILPLVPKIFFILNKKDYLSAESLSRVLKFNQKVLANLTGDSVPIFAISALKGLQGKQADAVDQIRNSGLAHVEQELTTFLENARGKTIILSNADRLQRLCQEWLNLKTLETRARKLSLQELQNNLSRFKQFMADTERKKRHLEFQLEGIKTRLLQYFDQESAAFIAKTTPELVTNLHKWIDSERGPSQKKLMEASERKGNNLIIDRFEPYRLLLEKEIRKQYVEEIAAINQEVKSILKEIYRFSAKLFQLEGLPDSYEEIWRYQSRFYYKTWDSQTSLDLIENALLTYLPAPLFRKLLKRHIQKQLPIKFERQRGLFRADVLYAVQENNRLFLYEFQQVIKRIQEEITELISRQIQQKTAGEVELRSIERDRNRIETAIHRVLDTIMQIRKEWQDNPVD